MGRVSMGRVMPHTTPNRDMAWDTSIPPATSRAGMSTELAEFIRLPATAVSDSSTEYTGMIS